MVRRWSSGDRAFLLASIAAMAWAGYAVVRPYALLGAWTGNVIGCFRFEVIAHESWHDWVFDTLLTEAPWIRGSNEAGPFLMLSLSPLVGVVLVGLWRLSPKRPAFPGASPHRSADAPPLRDGSSLE